MKGKLITDAGGYRFIVDAHKYMDSPVSLSPPVSNAVCRNTLIVFSRIWTRPSSKV